MILSGQYIAVPAGVVGSPAGALATVVSTDVQDGRYVSIDAQLLSGRLVQIMPQEVGIHEVIATCYVSWNGYDRAYDITHECGQLDAHCPARELLERDLADAEAEALHP